MPIAEFSNWPRRVIWVRILRGRHHGTRLWNSVDAKWLWRILQSSCLFSVFSNINGKHENTLTTSKKYSWCIPVQNEIKPIIWGAAITPEPYSVDLFSRIPTLESRGSYETSRQKLSNDTVTSHVSLWPITAANRDGCFLKQFMQAYCRQNIQELLALYEDNLRWLYFPHEWSAKRKAFHFMTSYRKSIC